MNRLTLTRQIDKGNVLSFMACVDGIPVHNSFTTDPWDILWLAEVKGTLEETDEFINAIYFNTCDCGVAGCNGFDSYDTSEENGFVTVFQDGKELYLFDQVQILEELYRVISEASSSKLWKTVWWDIGSLGEDDFDFVVESRNNIKDLLEKITVALEG
jgi:hypothetical protein